MIEPLQSDDALLADVASTPRDGSRLDLWWLGQSGYLVQHDQTRVVFDPYLSESLTRKYATTQKPHDRVSRRVVNPAKLVGIDLITSTHAHTDHLDADTLNPLLEANPNAQVVYARATKGVVEERVKAPAHLVAMSAGDSRTLGDITITAVPAAHDRIELDAAGDHKFLGYVVRLGDFRIYHSGDGLPFDGLAETVKRLGPIDLAILPINGMVGNMDGAAAANLAKAIDAKLVVPCHYDLFAFNTADPNAKFVPECERIGQQHRVLRLGERMTMRRS